MKKFDEFTKSINESKYEVNLIKFSKYMHSNFSENSKYEIIIEFKGMYTWSNNKSLNNTDFTQYTNELLNKYTLSKIIIANLDTKYMYTDRGPTGDHITYYTFTFDDNSHIINTNQLSTNIIKDKDNLFKVLLSDYDFYSKASNIIKETFN